MISKYKLFITKIQTWLWFYKIEFGAEEVAQLETVLEEHA